MSTSPSRSCSSLLCYTDWAKVTVLSCHTCFNTLPNLLMAYLGWRIIHDSGNTLEPRKAICISTGYSREDLTTGLFHYKIQLWIYHLKHIFMDIPEDIYSIKWWIITWTFYLAIRNITKYLHPFFCCSGLKPLSSLINQSVIWHLSTHHPSPLTYLSTHPRILSVLSSMMPILLSLYHLSVSTIKKKVFLFILNLLPTQGSK